MFPDAIKLEAVAAVRDGRSVSDVAAELGLADRLVRGWLGWAESRPEAGSRAPVATSTKTSAAPARRVGPSPADQAAEIARLRRELDRVRMERDAWPLVLMRSADRVPIKSAHVRRECGWLGVLQADAYAGFNGLYDTARRPGPVMEAGCWAHARRKLFDLAEIAKAPIAADAVRRIDVNRAGFAGGSEP